MSTTKLDGLSAAYDRAESGFLGAILEQADRAAPAQLARAVANAAGAVNVEAYRKFHAGEEDAWLPLDWLTERTEVLTEMWQDLAAAFEA